MKTLLGFVGTLIFAVGLAGCAGQLDYSPPAVGSVDVANSKIVNRGFESVWASAIPGIAESFFVINNLAKDSGIINVTYNGDPEQFLDCGMFRSTVTNARGTRVYEFPGASAFQTYEVMDPSEGILLTRIQRQLSLEGRENILFESVDDSHTKVSVYVRYVVTLEGTITDVNGYSHSYQRTVNFSTGDGPHAFTPHHTVCKSNGQFERNILGMIQ